MRERAKKGLTVSAAVLLCGCAYLVLYRFTGIGIPCLFHLFTGLNCPGCGVTRMLLHLVQFDFAGAFRDNAVLFCLLPVLLFLLIYWIVRYIRIGKSVLPKPIQVLCWVLVGILIAWGVVRNLIGM